MHIEACPHVLAAAGGYQSREVRLVGSLVGAETGVAVDAVDAVVSLHPAEFGPDGCAEGYGSVCLVEPLAAQRVEQFFVLSEPHAVVVVAELSEEVE